MPSTDNQCLSLLTGIPVCRSSSTVPDCRHTFSHRHEAAVIVRVRGLFLMTFVAANTCKVLLLIVVSLIGKSEASSLIRGATAQMRAELADK